MAVKRGFFNLFRKDSEALRDEETKQRDYALGKEREEKLNTSNRSNVVVAPEMSAVSEKKAAVLPPVSDEIVAFCSEKLELILRQSLLFGQAEVTKNENNQLSLEIINSEDLGRIIGKDGATINSLQILLRAFVYKKFNQPIRLVLDAGNYKKKNEGITAKAKKVADNVLKYRKAIALEPMSAQDRRLIHVLFQNDKNIETESAGEGAERHIVLSLK